MKHSFCVVRSPIGYLRIEEEEGGITRIDLGVAHQEVPPSTPLLNEACKQLTEYFAGTRKQFDLPLSLKGTEFQIADWNALREIPYGETRCYQEIATAIGRPKAARAVGMANHKNPILIVIPCHRCIGKNGKSRGFGCGIDTQLFLLNLEGEQQ